MSHSLMIAHVILSSWQVKFAHPYCNELLITGLLNLEARPMHPALVLGPSSLHCFSALASHPQKGDMVNID